MGCQTQAVDPGLKDVRAGPGEVKKRPRTGEAKKRRIVIYSDVDDFLNSNNLFHDFGGWLFQKLIISSFSFFSTWFRVIFGLSSSFWYVCFRFQAPEHFFETFCSFGWEGDRKVGVSKISVTTN